MHTLAVPGASYGAGVQERGGAAARVQVSVCGCVGVWVRARAHSTVLVTV